MRRAVEQSRAWMDAVLDDQGQEHSFTTTEILGLARERVPDVADSTLRRWLIQRLHYRGYQAGPAMGSRGITWTPPGMHRPAPQPGARELRAQRRALQEQLAGVLRRLAEIDALLAALP